jgi:predicted acetyltransferase
MDPERIARHHDAGVDATEEARLAESGLGLRRVPNDDRERFGRWLDAVARGFLDEERTDEQRAAAFERLGQRRLIGVFDASAPEPEVPVATFASWATELSVPGGRVVPSSAVSSVTVAPTHRRRGILRSMMDGELRVARAAKLPVSVLTVSESTIYGRFGYAPAAFGASWTIDAKRAAWLGPVPSGRIDFVSRERYREIAPVLHDRVRTASPGEIEMPHGHWDRLAGTRPDAEKPGRHRAIQYTDATGEIQGALLYSLRENHDDFTKATLTVELLIAATPDAYAALWKFALEHDLVGTVRANELSLDEPLRWMISDQRAATVTARDHQYVRILDVPAALEARAYAQPAVVALDVTDPLGFAGGRWVLRVDAHGRGTVHEGEPDAAEEAVSVSLGILELSAAYLGGVSLATLAAAGRVASSDAEQAARVFAWPVTPRLSFWY